MLIEINYIEPNNSEPYWLITLWPSNGSRPQYYVAYTWGDVLNILQGL